MANRSGKQGKYSDLYQTLQVLPMHGARRTLLVLLMIALVKATTVNTKELATAMETGVTLEANVRRIERFLAALVLKSDYVARLLMALLPFEGRYRLSLDRTNWQFGSKKINVLVLAVVYEGMAIPILWSFLAGKKGNSNQAERIALLERFIDLFGTAQIEWLSADREFIGREWWAYLQAKGIVFYIRIRHHLHIEREGKKLMHASHLFKRLVVGQAWLYPKAVIIGGVVVYLTAKKIPTQHDRWEWLIVASNQAAPDAFEQYAQRWQIETMFKALKTNGFNFEDTHIKHDERLDQLMMVLALTFVWAYKMGIYKHTHLKAITKKAHGRMAHSWFNYGLDMLKQVFRNPDHFVNEVVFVQRLFRNQPPFDQQLFLSGT